MQRIWHSRHPLPFRAQTEKDDNLGEDERKTPSAVEEGREEKIERASESNQARKDAAPPLASSSSFASHQTDDKVARWQNLIPSFSWIAPGWRAWGRNPRKGRDQILPSGNHEGRPLLRQRRLLPRQHVQELWRDRRGGQAAARRVSGMAWHCCFSRVHCYISTG